MNEPLTNSLPGISFIGKTYNKHPQWYNQPLRLTEEQKQDPIPVLDDFFECYHLNDTREILWTWLTVVVSSSRSISIESLERSNHVYFYEKIEEVIEAAFIITRRIHKHRLRNVPDQATNIHIPDFEIVEKGEILNKPKQLIEFVNDAPVYVIGEVFNNESLPSLLKQLRDWLRVALCDDSSTYEDGEQRRQLMAFHEELQMLVEALFVIHKQRIGDGNATNKISLLSQDQIGNPMQVLASFYEKFPIAYVYREFNDWLEAGISYPGSYPEGMSELQALHTYRNVLCLVRSADQLLKSDNC
ncbi:MAG TPA: hypothetical protein VF008_29590 [Niastella sp.]